MSKKLGSKEYIMLIADALTNEYGQTLREYDTDIHLADAVLKALEDYLPFNKVDITVKDFIAWKNKSSNR